VDDNPIIVEPVTPVVPEAPPRAFYQRGFLAEWAVTVVLLLFGTTTLVQAFVIPTGSMEDTLLIGDHLLVDKLAYAPPGSVSTHILPYTEVKRGDIIVFRYPADIQQTFVKRCIGVPGDRPGIWMSRDAIVFCGSVRIVPAAPEAHKQVVCDQ